MKTRPLVLALVVGGVFLACGAPDEPDGPGASRCQDTGGCQDSGDQRLPGLPIPGAGGGSGSTDTGSGSSGGTGGSTGVDGGAGGGAEAGAGGGSTPQANVAERVWKAQENVHLTASNLRDTYGEWAIAWLANAADAAGASGNVTTGTLTEQSDGSLRYAPGGTTLRIVRRSGYAFDISVQTLTGDVRAEDFPDTDDRLIATFVWPEGVSLRCDVAEKDLAFKGGYFEDDDSLTLVDVTESLDSEVWSGPGPGGTGYSVEGFGEAEYSGLIIRGDDTIEYDSSLVYSTCGGSCGASAAYDYRFTHSVTVSRGADKFQLDYHTGFLQQTAASLKSHYWDGDIFLNGAKVGALVKRPGVSSTYALEVVIGSDTWLVRGVAE